MPQLFARPWRWKHLLKLFVWYGLDSLVLLVPARRRDDHVLLIRLDNIGDFVLWLRSAEDVVRFYREQGKVVSLVASSPWASWAEQLQIFDRVISLNRTLYAMSPRYRLRFNTRLRRMGAQIAVVPGFSHDWAQGDAVARVCGARERIASVGDPQFGTALEHMLSRRWYTRLLPSSAAPLMELERNAEFATQLLQRPCTAKGFDLRGRAPMQNAFSDLHLPAAFYVLVPGASEGLKRWPVSNFRNLAQHLYERTGWLGVLCGGPEEHGLAEQVAAGLTAPLLNLTGKTSLSSLTALLAAASIVVANDTAAVHMAAAVGTPTVCVLGGGHVGRFLPYPESTLVFPTAPVAVTHPMPCFGCHWACIFPLGPDEPAPCVRDVGFTAVWAAVVAALSEGHTKTGRVAGDGSEA